MNCTREPVYVKGTKRERECVCVCLSERERERERERIMRLVVGRHFSFIHSKRIY